VQGKELSEKRRLIRRVFALVYMKLSCFHLLNIIVKNLYKKPYVDGMLNYIKLIEIKKKKEDVDR